MSEEFDTDAIAQALEAVSPYMLTQRAMNVSHLEIPARVSVDWFTLLELLRFVRIGICPQCQAIYNLADGMRWSGGWRCWHCPFTLNDAEAKEIVDQFCVSVEPLAHLRRIRERKDGQ